MHSTTSVHLNTPDLILGNPFNSFSGELNINLSDFGLGQTISGYRE